jgi:hypothetical protein
MCSLCRLSVRLFPISFFTLFAGSDALPTAGFCPITPLFPISIPLASSRRRRRRRRHLELKTTEYQGCRGCAAGVPPFRSAGPFGCATFGCAAGTGVPRVCRGCTAGVPLFWSAGPFGCAAFGCTAFKWGKVVGQIEAWHACYRIADSVGCVKNCAQKQLELH